MHAPPDETRAGAESRLSAQRGGPMRHGGAGMIEATVAARMDARRMRPRGDRGRRTMIEPLRVVAGLVRLVFRFARGVALVYVLFNLPLLVARGLNDAWRLP
jgi:hypothetical protein